MRGARLDRGTAPGDARRARRRAVGRAKSQEDALNGQASIFALEEASSGPGVRNQHPPLVGEEFQQRELLAMEKETLGTFLSDHPLSEVRDALRVRTDCSLTDLDDKPDGAWVTVGGIVAECKKIRTRNGSNMMFATLDDLEGRVEMIVFAKTLEKTGDSIDTDAVLLVRGKVDHKDRSETKLVVQDVEVFEPTAEEMEGAKEKVAELERRENFTISLDAAAFTPDVIERLKELFAEFPGDDRVEIDDVHPRGTAQARPRRGVDRHAQRRPQRRGRPAPELPAARCLIHGRRPPARARVRVSATAARLRRPRRGPRPRRCSGGKS